MLNQGGCISISGHRADGHATDDCIEKVEKAFKRQSMSYPLACSYQEGARIRCLEVSVVLKLESAEMEVLAQSKRVCKL
jgi:hypothetical protein